MSLIDTGQGLTAKDRSDIDSLLIDLLGNDYTSPINTISTDENKPKTYKYKGVEYTSLEDYKKAKTGTTTNETISVIEDPKNKNYYKEMYSKYDVSDKTMSEKAELSATLATNDYIKTYTKDDDAIAYAKYKMQGIAEKVSGYYRRYKDTRKLNFTDLEWAELLAEYEADTDYLGQEAADQKLNDKLKERVALNQGFWGKLGNGFIGVGTSAAGSYTMLAGAMYGAGKYLMDEELREELKRLGKNGFLSFWDTVIDNDVTRYGYDIFTYGSFRPAKIQEAKEDGFSWFPIHATKELENQVFSVNTVPEALSSYGFTIASMGSGQALSFLAKGISGGIKKSMVRKLAVEGFRRTAKSIGRVNAVERGFNLLAIPVIMGANEAQVNGLGTKITSYDEGKNYIESVLNDEKSVNEFIDQYIIQNSEAVNNKLQLLYNQYKQQHDPEGINNIYNEDLIKLQLLNQIKVDIKNDLRTQLYNELEYTSSVAGINDFFFNVTINSILFSTLGYHLLPPGTQKVIEDNKLFKKLFGSGFTTTTDAEGFTKVATDMIGTHLPYGMKSFLFEGTQEGLQEVSTLTYAHTADFRLKSYIDDIYNGQSMYEIGNLIEGTFAECLSSFPEYFASKRTLKAAVLGGISGAMGGPSIRSFIDNNTVYSRGLDGKMQGSISFKRLENENIAEYIGRLIPWRSGFVEEVREHRRDYEKAVQQAKKLEEWANKGDNKKRLLLAIKAVSNSNRLNRSTLDDDEFNYRNSTMAALIDDAINLKMLEGTDFYNSYMEELEKIVNMSNDSEAAKSFLDLIRNNVELKHLYKDTSDIDALNKIRKNASTLIETMDKASKIYEDINKTFGNIDEDVKHSLVYGNLMLEDWEKRSATLQSEILKAYELLDTSSIPKVENSEPFSEEDIDNLKKLNAIKNAKTNLEKAEEELASITLQLSLGLLSDSKKVNRKSLKQQQKNLKEKIKQYKKLIEKEVLLESLKNKLISFEDIIKLPSTVRAVLLNPLNKLYFNDKQNEIITKGILALTTKSFNIKTKIEDAAKIDTKRQEFLLEYAELLSDPNILNKYLYRRKLEARLALAQKTAEHLNTIDNYEDFYDNMKIYELSANQEDYLYMRAVLADLENKFLEQYEKHIEKLNDFIEFLSKSSYFKNLDANTLDLIFIAIKHIHDRNRDILDKSTIYKEIVENNEAFIEKIKEYNFKESDINLKLLVDDEECRHVYTEYSELISKYNNYIEEKELREREVTPSNSPSETHPPVSPEHGETNNLPVEDKLNVLGDVSDEDILDAEKTTDDTSNKELENLLNESIKELQQIINSSTEYAVKAKALLGIEKLKKLKDKSYTKEDILKIVLESNEAVLLLKNLIDNSKSNPEGDLPTIKTLDLVSIYNRDLSKGFMLLWKKYIEDNNIIEFLKNSDPAELQEKIKNGVVLISPVELLKNYVSSSDITENISNIPLVIAIKNSDGTYQPIAILPSSGNSKYSGNKRFDKYRKKIYDTLINTEAENITEQVLELEEEDSLTLNNVDYLLNATHSDIPNTLQDVAKNNLPQSDQSEFENKNSTVYKEEKKKIIQGITVEKEKTATGVSYTILKYNGIPIIINSISGSKSRKGKDIVQMINEEDVELLNTNSSNSRIFGFLSNLTGKLVAEATIAKIGKIGDNLNKENLDKFNESLNNALNKYIYYNHSDAYIEVENIIDNTYNRTIVLNIKINGDIVELHITVDNNISNAQKLQILKAILIDPETNTVRKLGDTEIFKWHVDYNNFKDEIPEDLLNKAKTHVSEVYDDNILTINASSLESSIKPLLFLFSETPAPTKTDNSVADTKIEENNSTTQISDSTPTFDTSVNSDTDTGLNVLLENTTTEDESLFDDIATTYDSMNGELLIPTIPNASNSNNTIEKEGYIIPTTNILKAEDGIIPDASIEALVEHLKENFPTEIWNALDEELKNKAIKCFYGK